MLFGLTTFGFFSFAGAAFFGVAAFLAALGAFDGVVDFGLAVLTRGFLTAPVAYLDKEREKKTRLVNTH